MSHSVTASPAQAENDHKGHHVTSPTLLLGVFGALMVLTVLTVWVTSIDFGNYNIFVALGVAVLKAGLVLMYFMHLRWDSPFNALIVVISLAFIMLFIAFSWIDTHQYAVNYDVPGAIAPAR